MTTNIDYKFVDREIILGLAPSYKDKEFFGIELDTAPFKGWLLVAEIGEEKDGYLSFECTVIGTPHETTEEEIQNGYESAIKVVENIIIKALSEASKKFEVKT